MAPVLEGDALEERAQQVALAVPAGDAVEAGAHEGALARAVEEGVEVGVSRRWRDLSHAAVAGAERILVMAAALDELAHVPFEVGGGGGARTRSP